MAKLDPVTAKALMESPHGVVLGKFLAETILELDTVRALPKDAADAVVAREARARELAAEKLQEVLAELLSGRDATPAGDDGDEYKM